MFLLYSMRRRRRQQQHHTRQSMSLYISTYISLIVVWLKHTLLWHRVAEHEKWIATPRSAHEGESRRCVWTGDVHSTNIIKYLTEKPMPSTNDTKTEYAEPICIKCECKTTQRCPDCLQPQPERIYTYTQNTLFSPFFFCFYLMPFKKVYPQERFSNCWKLHNENETVRDTLASMRLQKTMRVTSVK